MVKVMSDNTNKGELFMKIAELQAERDALAATVVTLRTAINENCFGSCNEPDGNVGIDGYPWAFRVLSETEDFAFCLAAHDAEVTAKAVEDAVSACETPMLVVVDCHTDTQKIFDCCESSDLKKYAAQLRAKAGA